MMRRAMIAAAAAPDMPNKDPRWQALSLVQAARDSLQLRDRDIAVLRGLLSLITAQAWNAGQMIMVYASNRVLSERCDGIEERTLLRRLTRLADCGLIRRAISPNRKRYLLRDGDGQVVQGYGFDLAPLRAALVRLAELAEAAQREQQDIKLLRKILRDRLWHLAQAGIDTPAYLPMLRNRTTVEKLRAAIADCENLLPEPLEGIEDIPSASVKMSDSDSDSVRDIQSSDKENLRKNTDQLQLQDCLERAEQATSYAPSPIRSWSDLQRLTDVLGPAMSIDHRLLNDAKAALGTKECSLAVIGILEAGSRIQRPAAYLARLIKEGTAGKLQIARMYQSLVRKNAGFRPETLQ